MRISVSRRKRDIKIKTIAYMAWVNSLQKAGFPRNPNNSWMNTWELYEYWNKNVDKRPWESYAKKTN